MIDLITMNKSGLSENEIFQIIEKNHLQTNSKAGVNYYDNERLKFADGFYLRIETNKTNRLKLECSLHKYYNKIYKNRQTNYDLFTFTNAKHTIDLLTQKTGIDIKELKVSYFEIGLNLILSKDCSETIDRMQTVGILENKRPLYVNPKYKNERLKNNSIS